MAGWIFIDLPRTIDKSELCDRHSLTERYRRTVAAAGTNLVYCGARRRVFQLPTHLRVLEKLFLEYRPPLLQADHAGSRYRSFEQPGGACAAGSPCADRSGRAAGAGDERGTPVLLRARSIHQPDSWWFTVKKGASVLPGELSHWPKHAHD